jgi:hypothetical protein
LKIKQIYENSHLFIRTGLWRLAPSSLVPQTFQLARKDVLNSKFNVESKYVIKMRPYYLKKQRWRRLPEVSSF